MRLAKAKSRNDPRSHSPGLGKERVAETSLGRFSSVPGGVGEGVGGSSVSYLALSPTLSSPNRFLLPLMVPPWVDDTAGHRLYFKRHVTRLPCSHVARFSEERLHPLVGPQKLRKNDDDDKRRFPSPLLFTV